MNNDEGPVQGRLFKERQTDSKKNMTLLLHLLKIIHVLISPGFWIFKSFVK